MPKTDCSYFCTRCGRKFTRIDVFKKHTIHRTEPSTKCHRRFPDIDWSAYCSAAEHQIIYYKKHKKYLYTEPPTAEQAAKLIDNSAHIHPIMRYSWQKSFYKGIIDKFLDRKRRMGYDVITVQAGYNSWERKQFTYLVKDAIIFAPYSKNKNLVQVGVVESTYFKPCDVRIMDIKGEEFYSRYKQYISLSDPNSLDDALVKNFYKINPERSVIHIDTDDKVWCMPDDIDAPMLCYSIESDNTVFQPNTDRRPDYGVSGKYFNITFNRNTRKFVEHDMPITKLVSECTYDRSHIMDIVYEKKEKRELETKHL